jgi:hypothetical protein
MFSQSLLDSYSKRWELGLQAVPNYYYQKLLQQVGYSLAVRNLAATIPGYPAETVMTTTLTYNRGFQAFMAYLFGYQS